MTTDDRPPASLPDPRRELILTTARRRFTTEGYASTRMEAVAREAAVSTATLYAYFPGKAELFAATIEDAAEDFSRKMSRVRAASGPAREQLLIFAEAYGGFMADPFVRSVFRLVMAERPRFRDTAMKFFEKGRTDFGAVLMAALVRLAETGELSMPKASWAAGQLMGMVEHPVFFMPLVTGDEVTARRSVRQIAEDAVETFLARYGAA
jgi:AcrR family transcriptional regulator